MAVFPKASFQTCATRYISLSIITSRVAVSPRLLPKSARLATCAHRKKTTKFHPDGAAVRVWLDRSLRCIQRRGPCYLDLATTPKQQQQQPQTQSTRHARHNNNTPFSLKSICAFVTKQFGALGSLGEPQRVVSCHLRACACWLHGSD